jgi:hypothetical protein
MKKTLLVLTAGVLVASAGTALAGTTFTGATPGVNTPVKVAIETFASATTFQVPWAMTGGISRTLSVLPVAGTNYFLDLNIGAGITPADATQSGVAWTGVGFTPWVWYSGGGGCSLSSASLAPGSTTTHQRWVIQFAGTCTSSPTLMIGQGGSTWNDIIDSRAASANLGAPGGVSIKEQVRFLDSFSQTEFPTDAGSTIVDYVVSAYATSATMTATTATINLSTQGKNFLVNPDPDTIVTDVGASIKLVNDGTLYDWAGPRGATFSPTGTTGGFYNVTFTSPNRIPAFTGVTSVTVGGGANLATSTTPLTTRNWSFSNAASAVAGIETIVSTIDGTTPQLAGSFTVTVDYYDGACTGSGGTTCTAGKTVAHSITLTGTGAPTYTVWTLNGTVLFAPMVNGNTAAFMQRFYICAPLSAVTATTFDVLITTVPVIGSTSVPLGSGVFTVNSTLEPGGCMNIKLEDLLAQIGVPTPYTAEGGNLAVKLSFAAPNVVGIHQSTNAPSLGSPSSFVTAPMIRLNKSAISDPGL